MYVLPNLLLNPNEQTPLIIKSNSHARPEALL